MLPRSSFALANFFVGGEIGSWGLGIWFGGGEGEGEGEVERGERGGMRTFDEVFSLWTLLKSFLKTIRHLLALELVGCCLKCPVYY